MMKYFDVILTLLLVFIFVGIELGWRWNDKRKIYEYVNRKRGEVRYISKLALREHIYNVEYDVDGEKRSATVQFLIFQEETWY